MAFSGMGANGGAGRGRWSNRGGSMSEMNIVPMVDVMLVLLVIFMLTASTMEFGLNIKAPAVKHVTQSTAQSFAVISVAKDGSTYLGDKPVNINLLGQEIKARYKDAKAVYVKADGKSIWEPVANVIAEVGAQTKLPINVVTRLDDKR